VGVLKKPVPLASSQLHFALRLKKGSMMDDNHAIFCVKLLFQHPHSQQLKNLTHPITNHHQINKQASPQSHHIKKISTPQKEKACTYIREGYSWSTYTIAPPCCYLALQ
jgi:hypothetical protein